MGLWQALLRSAKIVSNRLEDYSSLDFLSIDGRILHQRNGHRTCEGQVIFPGGKAKMALSYGLPQPHGGVAPRQYEGRYHPRSRCA